MSLVYCVFNTFSLKKKIPVTYEVNHSFFSKWPLLFHIIYYYYNIDYNINIIIQVYFPLMQLNMILRLKRIFDRCAMDQHKVSSKYCCFGFVFTFYSVFSVISLFWIPPEFNFKATMHIYSLYQILNECMP